MVGPVFLRFFPTTQVTQVNLLLDTKVLQTALQIRIPREREEFVCVILSQRSSPSFPSLYRDGDRGRSKIRGQPWKETDLGRLSVHSSFGFTR